MGILPVGGLPDGSLSDGGLPDGGLPDEGLPDEAPARWEFARDVRRAGSGAWHPARGLGAGASHREVMLRRKVPGIARFGPAAVSAGVRGKKCVAGCGDGARRPVRGPLVGPWWRCGGAGSQLQGVASRIRSVPS